MHLLTYSHGQKEGTVFRIRYNLGRRFTRKERSLEGVGKIVLRLSSKFLSEINYRPRRIMAIFVPRFFGISLL